MHIAHRPKVNGTEWNEKWSREGKLIILIMKYISVDLGDYCRKLKLLLFANEERRTKSSKFKFDPFFIISSDECWLEMREKCTLYLPCTLNIFNKHWNVTVCNGKLTVYSIVVIWFEFLFSFYFSFFPIFWDVVLYLHSFNY